MRIKSKIFLALALIFIVLPVFVSVAQAQTPIDFGLNDASNIGLPNTAQDPKEAAVNTVRYLMSFLGIIAVIVILLGGFKWMVAGGNDDKVAEAKKLIIAGLIGLVIIIAAFAIVQIVISTTINMIGA
mgnify:CR=1 FL=1